MDVAEVGLEASHKGGITLYRYLQLYLWFLIYGFKAIRNQGWGIAVGAVGFVMSNVALLATYLVLFRYVGGVGGWGPDKVVLLFGVTSLVRALWDVLMFNMTELERMVQGGDLDRLLMRPINPLFHLLAEKLDPDTLGELVFSIALIAFVWHRAGVGGGIDSIVLGGIAVSSAVAVFAGLHLCANATVFWLGRASGVNFTLWRLDEFSRYPLSIFPSWLRTLLTWVIPYGFVGYYQVSLLLRPHSELVWLVPLVGGLVAGFSYLVWLKGLERYQGTGS